MHLDRCRGQLVSAVIDRLSKQYSRLSFDVLSTDNVTARRVLEERRVD